MTQDAAEVNADQSSTEADAAFAAGYSAVQEQSSPGAGAEPEVAAQAIEKSQEAPVTGDTPAHQPEETPEPVRIAGYTEDELRQALAQSSGAPAEIRKAFGKIGEIQRTLQELTTKLSAAPQGRGRKITSDLLKRVNEEIPGLGDALAEDLSGIFVGAEEAQAEAAARGEAFDVKAWQERELTPMLAAVEAKATEKAQYELLEWIHRDYETVLKSDAFSSWLGTLPAERQKTIVESPRALVAADAITEFKEWQKREVTAKESKKNRLERAVVPSGGGAGGPTEPDPNEAFAAGFKKAAGR